ncbi:hypothetical protein GQ44DRAFT_732872 [Phaeosphaeriaceae sp. PMI808]|nr:hypothetical protein GQ44DRAFT_732872 [Phaeosphaeriaceae sp. PMI808]
MQLFNSLGLMFTRLSYLALYLRLAATKKFRVVLYISIALVSAYGIATAIVCMTLCVPFEKLWTPTIPGHCINIKAFWTANPALGIVFDIAIFVLPIPLLWGLKLELTPPSVIIASILRLRTLLIMLNTPAWSTVDSLNWSTVETHLAILISCTAAFKTLIQRFLPGILGSLSTTKHSLSRSQHKYTTNGGGHLSQLRTHDELNHKSGIREGIPRVDENGSQEFILDDLEASQFDNTSNIRAVSETSINDGVTEGCSPVCSISGRLIHALRFVLANTSVAQRYLWKVLSWHGCIRLSPKSSYVTKIPKKEYDLEVSNETELSVAFGIKADYMLSLRFLAIYHLMAIIPLFISRLDPDGLILSSLFLEHYR